MDKPLQPGKFKGKGRGSVSGEMASLELKEAYNKTQFKKKKLLSFPMPSLRVF